MAKTKKLQKFTDFEKLPTLKELKKHLGNDKEKASEMLDPLQDRLNKSYNNKLGEEYKIMNLVELCYHVLEQDKNLTELKNVTYETNQVIITSYLHNFILENRYFPAITQISKEIGLSRQTIYKHLDSGLKNKYNALVKGKIEYMVTNALTKLYYIGVEERNATALKHFIELSGAVTKKETKVNNYIQINNLKITKDDFNNLPNETILEVEQLISKSLTQVKDFKKKKI